MTIAEVIELENNRKSPDTFGRIHFIKEGNFYRAHDISAWLITMMPFSEAIKNVSINEEFFNSGFTTIPEVLLCEIGAQSSCASILARPENAGKLGFFMAIENAVFYRPVYPGDQMIIKADLPAAGKSKFGKGSGKIYVGDELVFEITLMFAIVDA